MINKSQYIVKSCGDPGRMNNLVSSHLTVEKSFVFLFQFFGRHRIKRSVKLSAKEIVSKWEV